MWHIHERIRMLTLHSLKNCNYLIKSRFDCVLNEKNVDSVDDFDHFEIDIFVVDIQFVIIVDFVVDEILNLVDKRRFHVL